MKHGIDKIGTIEQSGLKIQTAEAAQDSPSRYLARDDQGIDCKGALTFRQDEKRIDVDAFNPVRIPMREYG